MSTRWVHLQTYDRNGVLIWDAARGDIDTPLSDLPGGRCIRVSSLNDAIGLGDDVDVVVAVEERNE